MTFGTSSGAVQGDGNGLTVTDEDIRPQTDTGSDSPKDAPKADKQQDQSQPKGDAKQSKDGQQADPAAKEKGPGPWDAKLAELGLTDPRFSEFFRSEVQPYITQLEQGGQGNDVFEGDTEAAQAAKDLLDEFRADPVKAYRELGELLELTGEGMGPEGAPADDLGYTEDDLGDTEGDVQEPSDPRLEYVDDLIRRERESKEDEEYNGFLDSMGERMPGFDPDLFTTFVVANAGNLDLAMTQYEKYHRAPEPTPEAPPTIDGGTAPPSAPKYGSIGDSISSWLNDEKAATGRRS